MLDNLGDEVKYTLKNTVSKWEKRVLIAVGFAVVLVIAYFYLTRKYSSQLSWLLRHHSKV